MKSERWVGVVVATVNVVLVLFCLYEWAKIRAVTYENEFLASFQQESQREMGEDERLIVELREMSKNLEKEMEKINSLVEEGKQKNNEQLAALTLKLTTEIKNIKSELSKGDPLTSLLQHLSNFFDQTMEEEKEKIPAVHSEKMLKDYLWTYKEITNELKEMDSKFNSSLQYLKKISLDKGKGSNKYLGFGNWYGEFELVEEPPINRTHLALLEQNYIKSKLRDSNDHVLVMISCEASIYQLWQSRTAAHALRQVNQKHILRVLNVPTTNRINDFFREFKNYTNLKSLYIHNQFEDAPIDQNLIKSWSFDELPTFISPSYSYDPVTTDYYPPLNRIRGLIDFFEYIDNLKERNLPNPYENITSIVLIDPDMLVTKPFQYEPDRYHPIGHPSGYMNMQKNSKMVYKYTNTTPEHAQDAFTPLVINIDDLRSIMSDWLNITVLLRADTDKSVVEPKNWICEMYGYVLSSAIHNLKHHAPFNFCASPPYDRDNKPGSDPDVLHYCYSFNYGSYEWYKQHYSNVVPYPRPIPPPPSNATLSAKLFIQLLSDSLVAVYGPDDTYNPHFPN